MADGKRRLIEAAARLTRQDPLAMPGLRAIAREAGLNHNTFYRHFADMDALREAAATSFAAELQAELARSRLDVGQTPPDSIIGTLFDLAASQPDTLTLAYRILHGGPCPARKTMQALTAGLAATLVADLAALSLLPPEPDLPRLLRMLEVDIAHLLTLAMRLIETPPARDALQAQAGELLLVLLTGLKKRRLLA